MPILFTACLIENPLNSFRKLVVDQYVHWGCLLSYLLVQAFARLLHKLNAV